MYLQPLLAYLLLLSPFLYAHDGPTKLPEPESIEEAWNVINACSANVDQLLKLKLTGEIQFQIANAIGAMVFLQTHPADKQNITEIETQVAAFISIGKQIIVAQQDKATQVADLGEKWKEGIKSIRQLESLYPKSMRQSIVYICPMHPQDRHLKPVDTCTICSMKLIRRHLPASNIYNQPGQTSINAAIIGGPLQVGKSNALKLHLSHPDGSPVLPTDLLVMHTERIHLLINDRTLSDYHHEHPKPTTVPGEYGFSFTPTKPGAYRVWADIVPAASSMQQYVWADIAADTVADTRVGPLTERPTITKASVNGRTYEMHLNNGHSIHAGQTVIGTISISESDGKPCVGLEPVMEAFAHIVGFSEDYKTILHIHPFSKTPTAPTDRAGPAFAFKLYAPTPGFLRLYGQVQIDGAAQFPMFGITILPTAIGPPDLKKDGIPK